MKRILWIVLGSLAAVSAYPASYDCRNAHLTDIEKQICADENVSVQDEKLATLYRKLQAGATATQREALKADQLQWVRETRNVCTYKDCLGNAYRMRIEYLEELILDGWQTWVSEKEASAELTRRSGISESDRKELGSTQLAINIGAFGSFIAVDLKINKMLAQKIAGSFSACSSELQATQSNWEMTRDRKCNQEADDEAEGGSMRAMIFSTCKEVATKERVVYLRSLKSCEAVQ